MATKTDKTESKNFIDLLKKCTGGEVITISKYLKGSPFTEANATSVEFQIALYFVYKRREDPAFVWAQAEAETLEDMYHFLGVTVFDDTAEAEDGKA